MENVENKVFLLSS